MRSISFFSVILAFAQNALAANQFITPPPMETNEDLRQNPKYIIGNEVVFRWDTDYEQVNLYLWYSDPNRSSTSNQLLRANVSSRTFSWTPNLDGFPALSSSANNVFSLYFHDSKYISGNQTHTFSHQFNVTEAAAASVTPAGLSAGAAAGIAVGATLGTILVVCLGVFMAWRLRQKRQRLGGQHSGTWDNISPAQAVVPVQAEHYTEWKPSTQALPAELGGNGHNAYAELSIVRS
nr:uncharacterized protein CTRU02_08930 [Colletotrichum truncatum]KAF6789138.1 hypothetical protein CTRU02_08930 [Colletotrichum truncatum]